MVWELYRSMAHPFVQKLIIISGPVWGHYIVWARSCDGTHSASVWPSSRQTPGPPCRTLQIGLRLAMAWWMVALRPAYAPSSELFTPTRAMERHVAQGSVNKVPGVLLCSTFNSSPVLSVFICSQKDDQWGCERFVNVFLQKDSDLSMHSCMRIRCLLLTFRSNGNTAIHYSVVFVCVVSTHEGCF